MTGKLIGRGEDRNGNEYTHEIYGERGFGPATPFPCDSCGDTQKVGDEVFLVEDGTGFCADCWSSPERDCGEPDLDYHCGVHPSDFAW